MCKKPLLSIFWGKFDPKPKYKIFGGDFKLGGFPPPPEKA